MPDSIYKPLSSLSQHYTTYLIDVAGVVHDGHAPFLEAVHAINKLLEQKKTIIFVSNAPRPQESVQKNLRDIGIHPGFFVVTSGDLTLYTLATHYQNHAIYHLGTEKNKDMEHVSGCRWVHTMKEADLCLLSLFLEESEDPTTYTPLLEEVARTGKPVLCANPDKRALYKKTLRYTAGYFADQLRALGSPVKILGKPSIDIYQFVEEKIPSLKEQKNSTLMIGDTLETDILGAHNYGIDSLLVLSGITGKDLKDTSLDTATYCAQKKLPFPTYIDSCLRWE